MTTAGTATGVLTVPDDSTGDPTRRRSSTFNTRLSLDPPEASSSTPLSVKDVIAGLSAALSHAQSQVVAFDNGQPSLILATLGSVHNGLKSVSRSLSQLHRTLRAIEGDSQRNGVSAQRASLVDIDTVVAILTACVMTVSDLDEGLDNLVEARYASAAQRSQVERHLARDVNRLEIMNYMMSTLIIGVSSDHNTEALSECAQVKNDVAAMLRTDVAIATRLAYLEDSFNALVTVSFQRRDDMNSVPPPVYSLPTTSQDTLPGYTSTSDAAENRDGSVTIAPARWSLFSGLTLADLSDPALIPMPFLRSEIRCRGFYDDARHAMPRVVRNVAERVRNFVSLGNTAS